jgi:hypothetical protein
MALAFRPVSYLAIIFSREDFRAPTSSRAWRSCADRYPGAQGHLRLQLDVPQVYCRLASSLAVRRLPVVERFFGVNTLSASYSGWQVDLGCRCSESLAGRTAALLLIGAQPRHMQTLSAIRCAS